MYTKLKGMQGIRRTQCNSNIPGLYYQIQFSLSSCYRNTIRYIR